MRFGDGQCACCHRDQRGRRCGHDMGQGGGGDGGRHALVCPAGGGLAIRHNWVRDALHTWLIEQAKFPVKEQMCPEWDTEHEHAILELVYQD